MLTTTWRPVNAGNVVLWRIVLLIILMILRRIHRRVGLLTKVAHAISRSNISPKKNAIHMAGKGKNFHRQGHFGPSNRPPFSEWVWMSPVFLPTFLIAIQTLSSSFLRIVVAGGADRRNPQQEDWYYDRNTYDFDCVDTRRIFRKTSGAVFRSIAQGTAFPHSLERHGEGNESLSSKNYKKEHACNHDEGIPDQMRNRVFICEHNSARSQIAETSLDHFAGNRFHAESAGLKPGILNPYVVDILGEAGLDISGNTTKSVFDLNIHG